MAESYEEYTFSCGWAYSDVHKVRKHLNAAYIAYQDKDSEAFENNVAEMQLLLDVIQDLIKPGRVSYDDRVSKDQQSLEERGL